MSLNHAKTERTSSILFFWPSLTLPARQQWARAFWMMCLLDLALGSLYSLGPGSKRKRALMRHRNRNTNDAVLKMGTALTPVYSVLEGVDDEVESFSQSFSPLRLPAEGQDEKPSAESGLETIINDKWRGHNRRQQNRIGHTQKKQKIPQWDVHKHRWQTHTEGCGKTRSENVTQNSKLRLLSVLTLNCTHTHAYCSR